MSGSGQEQGLGDVLGEALEGFQVLHQMIEEKSAQFNRDRKLMRLYLTYLVPEDADEYEKVLRKRAEIVESLDEPGELERAQDAALQMYAQIGGVLEYDRKIKENTEKLQAMQYDPVKRSDITDRPTGSDED